MAITDIVIPTANQATGRVDDLVAARRVREALAVADQVVSTRRGSAAVLARLQVRRASLLFTMGRAAEALVVAKSLCRAGGAPDDVVAEAEVIQLLGLLAQDDFTDSRVLAEEMLGGGARGSTDDGLAGALAAFGAIAWEDGRVADALTFLQSSVERSDCGPLEGRRVHPRLMLARLLIALGEHDGARSLVEQARVEIDAGALTEWSAAPIASLAHLHFAAGRLDAAEKEARSAITLAQELGTEFVVPLASATLASVALARGRTAAAARAVALCHSVPAPTGMEFVAARWTLLSGRIATVQYGSDRGVAVLAPVYDATGRHKRLLLEEPAAGADLVRCALAAGEMRAARAVVGCTDQLAADNPTSRAVVAGADHARGLLDRDVALLERATATQVSPLAQAAATADLGMELVDEGEHDAGCARLERAIAMFECLGATGEGERIRSRLREASRRGRGERRSRPASASSALTPTERAVAQLAVKGLTNRQIGEQVFLSRHTVDFHLRHVYRKLEVKSRVHLTRLLLDRPSALYGN